MEQLKCIIKRYENPELRIDNALDKKHNIAAFLIILNNVFVCFTNLITNYNCLFEVQVQEF